MHVSPQTRPMIHFSVFFQLLTVYLFKVAFECVNMAVQFKEEWWLYYPTKCNHSAVYLMWVDQVQPLLPHGYEAIHFTLLLICHWDHSGSFFAPFCQHQNIVWKEFCSDINVCCLVVCLIFQRTVWRIIMNLNTLLVR